VVPDTFAVTGQASAGHRKTGSFLFPRGVRVWHFIVIPPVAMGAVLTLFRWLTSSFLDPAITSGTGFFPFVRVAVISLTMSLVIAWLAFRHRREYLVQIRAQNEDLVATRDFLSNVIRTSGEVIITLDAAGLITSWNQTAVEIYGWTQEEMLGETCERLFTGGEGKISMFRENVAKLQAGGSVRHEETTHRRKDGTIIMVHATMSPLFDRAGRYVGATSLIHDVTELVELQARLVDQERMAALGQMAAAVAHEIRNPLAGIRGACEILLKRAGQDDSRSELGKEMLYQVDRLSRSTHDLLTFARPKPRKPVPTKIDPIVERVLKNIEGDPKNKDIQVARQYDPGTGHVRVDPEQMEQVFFNVILNACQAMDLKGTIAILIRAVGDQVCVTVRDNGAGIPEDVISRIYEPFFTTRAQGTGLGLAIVRKIVDDHGGSIDARAPGDGAGGTEIVIQLPMES
jgi:PAS domain S-box-containing protein